MKKNRSLNILFLTVARISNLETRGIYTDLLREFRDNGHAITIVSPTERQYKKKTSYSSSGGVNILNVKTLNIQKTHFIEKGLATLLIEYQFSRAIKKYLSNSKFDLILYSTPPVTLNSPISFVKKRDKAFAYLMLKDIFPQNAVDLGVFSNKSIFYKFFRWKEKQLYNISDFIGCMSPANIAYIKKHNSSIKNQKIGLCPNAVDLKLVDVNCKKKETVTSKPLRFLYGGNLGKPQGLGFLKQIIEYYRNSDKVEFYVVGSGTEYSNLKDWIDKKDFNNAVLKGRLPEEEYNKLVKTADVGMIFLDKRFTIPNYPSRLLSYLQNKTPVFCAVDSSTDVGNIATKNRFGVSCLHGDINDAISKIDSLIQNKKNLEDMGTAGFKYLCSNYSTSIIYQKIMCQIYV